jgi:hypothetical protein
MAAMAANTKANFFMDYISDGVDRSQLNTKEVSIVPEKTELLAHGQNCSRSNELNFSLIAIKI